MTTTKKPVTLRKQFFYPHPPEAVWTALTDPRALAEWLMPNNFKPVLGHKFRFETDAQPGCTGLTECEVLELEPNRRLAYSWVIVPKPPKPKLPAMIVSWTLAPEAGGTRVVFEHEGLDRIPLWMRLGMRFGWHTMHSSWLRKVIANVDGTAFTPGAIPLAKRCYKVKTISKDMTV